MLKQLSKRDKEWRKITLKICGDKYLADDLVNDMYLKIHKIQPKEINTSYIAYSIYHLWLNYLKKESKTSYIDEINYIETDSNDYTTENRIKVDNILNELGFFDREILLHTHEKSLRRTAKSLNMNYGKVFYQKKIALNKLLETKGIKNWKHER